MGCNCQDTSPCSRCQNGKPCNCPPDYSVKPCGSQCQCCPNGYTYQQPTPKYPNGICIESDSSSSGWCCPPGSIYIGPTPNYPNGYCASSGPTSGTDITLPIACQTTAPIPCVLCEDAITTDCVTYSGIIPIACGAPPGNIYGINPGDTLTTIINKLCITNTNVLEAMISAVGLNPTILSGWCQINAQCPPSGGGGVIVSIIVTFP